MLIGPFVHGLVIESFKDRKNGLNDVELGYLISIGSLSVVCMIPFLVTIFLVEEKKSYRKNSFPFWEGVKKMVKNKAFMCVMLMFLFAQLSIQFIQNNLILFCKYVLDLESWFPYILVCLLGSTIVSLPFWSFMARKIGKKMLFLLGIALLFIVLCFCFFIPEGKPGEFNLYGCISIFILAGVAGFQLGTIFLIPHAMFPDVIELDELETGERREGIFFAFFVFFQKLGLAGAVSISNFILSFSGFVSSIDDNPDVVQPRAVIYSLKLMIGFIPAAILLLSLIPLYFYPITKEQHAQTLILLEKQRMERRHKFSALRRGKDGN